MKYSKYITLIFILLMQISPLMGAELVSYSESSSYLVAILALCLSICLFVFLYIFNKKKNDAIKLAKQLTNELSVVVSTGNIDVAKYIVSKNEFNTVYNRYGHISCDGFTLQNMIDSVDETYKQGYKEAFDELLNKKSNQTTLLISQNVKETNKNEHYRVTLNAIERNGVVEEIIVSKVNISDEVFYHQQLISERNKTFSIFKTASVGLSYYDRNGILIDINDATLKLLGITDKEAVLKKKTNLFENLIFNEKFDAANPSTLNEKLEVDCDYDLANVEKDYGVKSNLSGVIKIHLEAVPSFDANDNLEYVVVTVMDLTKINNIMDKYQSQSRETYELLETIPCGVEIYDNNYNLVYINDEHLAASTPISKKGYISRKLSIYDIFKALDFSVDLDQVRDYYETDIVVDCSKTRVRDHLGTSRTDTIYLTIRYKPLRGVDGKIEKIFAIHTDMTQHKKAVIKAQESDKLKSQFLANMSHEIRTPLNAIIGFSDLIVSTEDANDREEYGLIMRNNSELLLNLINDILDISKIEAGILDFTDEYFDINAMFDDAYAQFSLKIPKDVSFSYIKPEKELSICLDSKRVMQILYNFLSNAVKYTPSGTISFGYDLVENGITIYVEDTGIGIADKDKSKLFQRFEKFDTFAPGTGLGLTICKALADVKGGEVGCESIYGEGSTFWVWIPCEVINRSGEKWEEANNLYSDVSLNILVAEDLDDNFILINKLLEKHNLVRANNGKEAVDLCKKQKFDVVFMDLRMPVMNGLDATKAIREFDTQTPIIALTAFTSQATRKDSLNAGCSDYITKPLIRSTILKTINIWKSNKGKQIYENR